jgi:dipeptidyl aminopeptidase/acylaminoacyl peptidase
MAKRRAITPEDLLTLQYPGDPHVNPADGRVCFSLRKLEAKNRMVGQLWVHDPASGQQGAWTHHEAGASQGRWSPDGAQLAFVAKRGDSPQIHLLPAGGGEARTLTQLPEGSPAWLKWSPDGKWILLSFRETPANRTQAAEKDRKDKGEATPPVIVTDPFWRMDGDGVFESGRFHLYLVDSATGEHRVLHDKAAWGGASADWLPDSSGVIVCHSRHEDPSFLPADDGFWRVSLKGKAKAIACPVPGSKGTPRVSPDGSRLAWIGCEKSEGWGVHNQRLWMMSLEGGEPGCLTAELDEDFGVMTLSDTNPGHVSDGGGSGFLAWSPDGSHLLAGMGRHGADQLVKIDAESGELTWLTEGAHSFAPSAMSADGQTVYGTWATALRPAELAQFNLSKEKIEPMTAFNDEWTAALKLAEPEEHWLETPDGTQVHTWLMMPPGKRAKGEALPAVLEIHGGPHAQYGSAFFHEFQVLAAAGYAVVYSNPRGSKGYGEAHTAAIHHRWGDKDWQDIQTVLAWMKADPRLDSSRMGVMGGSYGGWMTNWVIGHTTEFKAAITDRCISNWLSAGATADFPLNARGYFGGPGYGPWEDNRELWEQSPISCFDKVETPTLIIHSEGDLRCPIEQSDQVFYALRSRGVECRYVRYPLSTSHGLSRNGPPDLRLHRLGEILAWWKEKLA